MAAKCESLLKWINTLGMRCESFRDLASGQILLECLHKIMPDVVVTNSAEPLKDVFSIFEGYCGCSLQKSVSAEEISLGNEEHIARVVVLLLSVAVQSKANEKVISDITSLDYEAQRDLMFFIESTLAKVKSHAIVAGTFTSGVGEQLPSLNTSDPANTSDAIPESPPSERVTPDSAVPKLQKSDDFVFATPRRPPKSLYQANFYNGLDSTAGAKLLMSPAITGRKKSFFGDSSPNSDYELSSEKEEISRLKHSLRVVEGTLQVEKKLAEEYYTELCTKIEEHEVLKKDYCQLERRLGCLQEMADLQDELAHTTSSLAAAEKAISSYKAKVESLEECREKAAILERTVASLQSEIASCDEYKIGMKKLEESLLEKTGALKRVELQLNTTTIQLEMKLAHMNSLLEENREAQRRFSEARMENLQLENLVKELREKLSEREDAEVKTMEEKRELTLTVQQMQETLDANRKEMMDLSARKSVCETSVAASEREKSELHTELEAKASALASRDLEVYSLQSKLQELTAEMARLRSEQEKVKDLEAEVAKLQAGVKTREHISAAEIARLEQELADKAATLTATVLERDSLKSTNEDMMVQISDLRSSIETMKEDRDASKQAFEGQTAELQATVENLNRERGASIVAFENKQLQLRNELASKASKLHSKDLEVESLTRAQEELKAKVAQLEVATKELQESTDTRVLALEHIKAELEAQVQQQIHQNESQEQRLNTMSAKVKSKELEVESLEKVRSELQAQVGRLQDCHRSLEENSSAKEAQIKHLMAELETDAGEHSNAQEAITAMRTELRSKQAKIQSLESSVGALEEKVLQFQSIHQTLEQDLNTAVARLAESEARASALVDVGEKLSGDVEVLQKELVSSRGKNTTVESEVSHKNNLLASLSGENTALQSKVLHLTELVAEQQSSLQTANDHAACLATQKAAVEEARSRLEAKLEGELQTKETVLTGYRSKLRFSEEVIDSLKQRMGTLGDQENVIKEMTRTNQLLQSEQTNFCKRLSAFEKREELLSSRCEELQAALASEQANSHRLTLASAALASEQANSRQLALASSTAAPVVTPQPMTTRNTSAATPFEEDTSVLQYQDNIQGKCEPNPGMEVEVVVDEKSRMRELRRRNKQALPHLKSSYPIEMQVKPETPSNSNERLKHGYSRVSSREKTSQALATPANQELGAVATRTRSASGGTRERSHKCTIAGPDATPTTQAPADYRRKQQLQSQRISSSLNLREFLDEDKIPNSTTFDITLSPPKTAAMPKRLQENKLRRKLKEEESDGVRRETMLKKPAVGNAHKFQGNSTGLGKKRPLRSRTHKN